MISVIIPIYNTDKELLIVCLDSVQNQTFSQYEVILIDDGSDGYISDICTAYTRQCSKFRYFRQVNSGVCDARNNGLMHAEGTYICFIDADDWIEGNYLEKLYQTIASCQADIALCDAAVHYQSRSAENHFLNTGQTAIEGREKNRLLYQLFGKKICPYYPPEIAAGVVWAKIFRKSFLDLYQLQFQSGMPRMEDNIFCLYAYEYARRIAYIPACLYHYRVGSHSVTHRYDPHIIRFFEKYYEEAGKYLDIFQKETILYNALQMKELTSFHSYLRYYFFHIPGTNRKTQNQQIKMLLNKSPYREALGQVDPQLLTKSEYLFVTSLKHHWFMLLRILIKLREIFTK